MTLPLLKAVTGRIFFLKKKERDNLTEASVRTGTVSLSFDIKGKMCVVSNLTQGSPWLWYAGSSPDMLMKWRPAFQRSERERSN
jgi:hypothetical protein